MQVCDLTPPHEAYVGYNHLELGKLMCSKVKTCHFFMVALNDMVHIL